MAKRSSAKAVKRKPRSSHLEEKALAQLKEEGVEKAEREYKFHPVRRWRFDFAWPKKKVALEIEGAIFTGGRHSRGAGMVKDMEKYNTAAELGWRVLRVGAPHLKDGQMVAWVKALLS